MTLTIKRQRTLFLGLIFFISGYFGYGQGLNITTVPALVNDTVYLCLDDQDSVRFSATFSSPFDSIKWNFQNGVPNSRTGGGPHWIKYSGTGNFRARVRVFIGGGLDTLLDIRVDVSQLGPVSFNVVDTICESDRPITLVATPAGGTFSGNGVFGNRFDPDAANVGINNISYSISNGSCSRTVTRQIFVEDAPEPVIRSSSGSISGNPSAAVLTYAICDSALGTTFQFYNNSFSNNYNSYSIDFGDSSPIGTGTIFPSGANRLPHTYPAPGSYTMTVTFINNSGCDRTQTINIFIGDDAPAVGLAAPSGAVNYCIPKDKGYVEICVGVNSVSNNPPETTYRLTSNDGLLDTTFAHPPPDSICHRFTITSCGFNDVSNFPNAFQIQLEAINPCGKKGSAVFPIYISTPSNGGFTNVSNGCVGKTITITDTTFGGSVVRNGNCISTGTANVLWDITPNTFTVAGGAASLGSTFGNLDPINWFSGAGALTVSFNDTGRYTIRQVVGNAFECGTDTVFQTICIEDTVQQFSVRLSADTICAGDSITASFVGDIFSVCDVLDIGWRKPQGNTGDIGITGIYDTTQNFIFYQAGIYPIRVVAKNSCDSLVVYDTVVVQSIPTVDFPSDTAICGLATIDMSASHLIPFIYDSLSAPQINWSVRPKTGWSFAGGTSDTSAAPLLDFTQYGVYYVLLSLTNECGSYTDSMEVSLTENPVLIANGSQFMDTILCPGSPLAYKASANQGLPPYSYEWGSWSQAGISFGDSVYLPPLFADTTLYIKVTDSLNCTDSIAFRVRVLPPPLVDAGLFSRLCYSDSIQINASITAGTGPFSVSWSPSAGLSDTAILNPWRSPLDSSVTYTLSVTDSLGCVYTDTISLSVYPQPVFNAGSNFIICLNQGDTALGGGVPQGGIWSGPGVTGSIFSPTAADTGTHSLVYLYTDPNGCAFVDSVLATVIPQPNPQFGLSVISGCSPLSVSFTDSSGAVTGQQWFINGQLFSTLPNPSQVFINNSADQDSLIDITLVFQAASGCSNSITKTITVQPVPLASFTMPSSACANDSLQLINSSLFKGSVVSYRWYSSSNSLIFSDTTIANPWLALPDFKAGTDSIYQVTLQVITSDGCSASATQSIIVRSRPEANFSLPISSCTPVIINPTDQSIGSGMIYNWSLSPTGSVNITGVNSSNPTFQFTSPAQDSLLYSIKLSVIDGNGCMDSVVKDYLVYAQPSASFNISRRDSCGPLKVTFNNTSNSSLSGNPNLSYQWDFGNGVTSLARDTVVSFNNFVTRDTTYIIGLIAQNDLGCADTIYDSVIVHPDPLAEINVTDSVGCAPFILDTNAVSVTDYPQANSAYTWLVFDKQQNLLQQFTGRAGLNYPLLTDGDTVFVQLLATSPFGCKNDTSDLQLIYTVENPIPAFSLSADSICSGETVQIFDSSSTGVGVHEWFVNDSLFSTQLNPTISLTNSSNTQDSLYVIKLRVTASLTGCSDSTSRTVRVHPSPQANFVVPSVFCGNDSIKVQNASIPGTGLTYSWSSSSADMSISDTSAIEPSVYFADNQSGSARNYQLKLSVTNSFGCSDSSVFNITVNSRPTADFSLPVDSCGPLSIVPINNTSGQSLSYNWSVEPLAGSLLTGANSAVPAITFQSPSQDSIIYLINLVVTGSNACVDSTKRSYTVFAKPQGGFVMSNNDSCGPLTVDFSNLSDPRISSQNIADMSFFWDFGNGQTSQDSAPSVSFTNTGLVDSLYVISLIATNSLGCSDTISDSVRVRPDPRAELDTAATSGCTPFVINDSIVKALLYPAANSSYDWTVLNWNTGTVLATATGSASLNYTMSAPGDSVLVRLVANSPFGCKSDTVEQLFRTIPNPVPAFVLNTNQGCQPLTVSITDASSPGLTYQWYIDNILQSTTQPNPAFVLTNTSVSQDSIYDIKLVVAAGSGCIDSVSQAVTVYALPNPLFTATEICGGDTTVFFNSTSTVDTIVQWAWNFGDGTAAIQRDPAHLFQAFGLYQVSLTATDSRGCDQTYVDTVIVRPKPIAGFTASASCGPDTACLNRPFSFADISNLDSLGGNLVSWEWDILDDGSIEYSTQNPQHIFNQPGIFPVKLIVSSQYGCADSIVQQVRVLDPITAFFVTDTNADCGPLDIIAIDSSTGPISEYQWELFSIDSLGNKVVIFTSQSANPNPIPTLIPSFVKDTTYTLELTVLNCCDTTKYQKSFTLKPLPVAGVSVLPPSGCSGFKVTFTIDGQTTGRPDSVIINFGDGTATQVIPVDSVNYQGTIIPVFGQLIHTYQNNGLSDTTYLFTLKAKNNCGDSTIQVPILVKPNIVQASFSYTPSQGCEDLIVSFSDASFAATNIAWSFDYDSLSLNVGQFTDSGAVVSHTYTESGSYLVAQVVDDGCSFDTAYATIAVWDSPEADFSFNNFVCEGDSIFFVNNTLIDTNTIGVYFWDFGDGDSSRQRDPVHVYDSVGVYQVQLISTTPNGCSDSIEYPVTIYDRPNVNFDVSDACVGAAVSIYDSTAISGSTIVQSIWRIDTIATYFSNPSPLVFSNPGLYEITLIQTSNNGCTDSITKVISINEVPTARFNVAQDTLIDSCGNIAAYIFQDQSISSTPLQYFWDFDLANPNTKTSTLRNPGTILYADTGYFSIRLTVWNSDSCWSIYDDTLYVEPKSRVDFSPLNPEACMGEAIQFFDSTRYRTGSGNNVLTYLWDFGDGDISTQKNPIHTYDSAGVYTIKLKVWDPSCVDSLTRQVIIHQTPDAFIDSGNYELCARNSISVSTSMIFNFSNGNQIDSLIWNLSDGRRFSVYRDSSISIYFENPGQYILDLVAITNKGCTDTSEFPVIITVHPRPVVTLDADQLNARTFNLIPTVSQASNAIYNWDFDDGNMQSLESIDSLAYRYEDRLCRIDSVIQRIVQLSVTNQIEDFGFCSDLDTVLIQMEGYHLNVPNAFAPDRVNVDDANLFIPKGIQLSEYRLQVFDEWGNIVFETMKLDKNGSPVEGWNGTFNDQDLPMGAYVWIIDAQFNDGYPWPVDACNTDGNIKAFGTVTLIR